MSHCWSQGLSEWRWKGDHRTAQIRGAFDSSFSIFLMRIPLSLNRYFRSCHLTVCSQILDLKTTGQGSGPENSPSTVLVIPNAFRSLKVRTAKNTKTSEQMLWTYRDSLLHLTSTLPTLLVGLQRIFSEHPREHSPTDRAESVAFGKRPLHRLQPCPFQAYIHPHPHPLVIINIAISS